MNTNMNNENDNENEGVKKKTILPVKYKKFAGFAYWLLGQMKDELALSADGYDNTCNMMHLLSRDVSSQIAFYKKFEAESKIYGRLMKVEAKNYIKPTEKSKLKKSKKSKSKSNKTTPLHL